MREDGIEKQVTAAEAFLLHLAKQGLEESQRPSRERSAQLNEAKRQAIAKTERHSK